MASIMTPQTNKRATITQRAIAATITRGPLLDWSSVELGVLGGNGRKPELGALLLIQDRQGIRD